MSPAMTEEGPAVDSPFPSFVIDVIREGSDTHYLEVEDFRGRVALLEQLERHPCIALNGVSELMSCY